VVSQNLTSITYTGKERQGEQTECSAGSTANVLNIPEKNNDQKVEPLDVFCVMLLKIH
jgi:hypothetical protein